MKETAQELGTSQPTLRKHMRRLGVVSYRMGTDYRSKVIKVDDLQRLRLWLNKATIRVN
jgi:hypothetical protein